jgi:hypothetical protein
MGIQDNLNKNLKADPKESQMNSEQKQRNSFGME